MLLDRVGSVRVSRGIAAAMRAIQLQRDCGNQADEHVVARNAVKSLDIANPEAPVEHRRRETLSAA
jgi:hypothetical protein